MKNNGLPSISAFPKDENYWRIDWFGEVVFPNRSIRRTQPSILVYLSKIVDGSFLYDPTALLFTTLTDSAKYQRKVWVSVGTLCLLRIGDIWRNGQPVNRPDYHLERFEDLRIDASTVYLVKAGSTRNGLGFLLPTLLHPWHLQCTHSYCALVPLPGANRQLMIPCMELIRFYFGSSSSLLTKLFLPPLERGQLYKKPRFAPSSGRLSLVLADGISGASASDIGRIHLDRHAWRAAQRVGISALRASVSREQIYPQAIFPFEGETCLTADGIWLPLGSQSMATFLAFNLRSCSHPFPFRSLRYEASGNSRRPIANQQEAGKSSTKQARRSASKSESPALVEQDASGKLAGEERKFFATVRFPDLQHKVVWRSRELVGSSTDSTFCGASAAVDSVSLGKPGSSNRIRPIELAEVVSPEALDRRPVPAFLQAAVRELEALTEMTVRLLTESSDDGWTVPLTTLSNEDGEIDMRLFLEESSGSERLRIRRAAVFGIRGRDGEHVSIAFVESTPLFTKFYTTTGANEDEIFDTLLCVSGDYVFRPSGDGQNVRELTNWIFGIPLQSGAKSS